MGLVGVAEIGRDAGEVGALLAGQALGRLVQAPALDQPLGGQPDPPSGESLEAALADRELLAHLADPAYVGVALDVLDDGVDQLALLVERREGAQRGLDHGDRGLLALAVVGVVAHRLPDRGLERRAVESGRLVERDRAVGQLVQRRA